MFDPAHPMFGATDAHRHYERLDRDTVVRTHADERQSILSQVVKDGEERTLFTTRVGIEHLAAPSACRLETLKTTHKKMFIGTDMRIHHGKYMLLRTIVDPFKVFALHTVVEDEKGTVMRMCLYNFVSPLFVHDDVSWALPRGQKLILLEPCIKMSVSGITVLRCDNPSHAILLDDGHNLLSDMRWRADPAEWPRHGGSLRLGTVHKDNGNQRFKNLAYCQAAACYSKALESLPKETVGTDDREAIVDMKTTVLSNRSETMLKLGQYHFALRDTLAALALRPQHGKSLLRKIRALIGMNLFNDAHTTASAALIDFTDGDVHTELLRFKQDLEIRLKKPSRMTDTEINELLDSCDWQKADDQRLLWPDFSRKLRVKRSTFARGRGTFAGELLRQGDIISVEKAMSIVYPNEVKKVVEQPVTYSGIVSSSYFDASGENKALIDAEKMELIYRLSMLSSHLVSVNRHVTELLGLPGHQLQADVDGGDSYRTNPVLLPISIESIETVCGRNATRPDSIHTVRRALADPKTQNKSKQPRTAKKQWSPSSPRSIGLWRKAGLINHRCSPNCSHILIGDILILVAMQDISDGEELSINYAAVCDSYSQRQATTGQYGFKCVCKRCRREEAHKAKYDRSVEKFFMLEKSFQARSSDEMATLMTSALSLQKAVMSITAGRKESLLLASINDLILQMYVRRRKPQEATKVAIAILPPLQCFDHDNHLLSVYQAVTYLLHACSVLSLTTTHMSSGAVAKSELEWKAKDYAARGLQLARLLLANSCELVKFVYGEDVFERLYSASFASEID